MESLVRVKHLRAKSGLSPKLVAAFLAFVAGREIFDLYTKVGVWLADLVGLGLWSAFMYLVPPRPKLLALLLATASLLLIVIVLHLFHFG